MHIDILIVAIVAHELTRHIVAGGAFVQFIAVR